MNKSSSKKGFTLIEIIMVVVIISILSLIFYGNMQGAREEGWNKSIKAQLQQLQVALELYKDTYGRYPAVNTPPADWDDYAVKNADQYKSLLDTYCKEISPPLDPSTLPSYCSSWAHEKDYILGLAPEFISELPSSVSDFPGISAMGICLFHYYTVSGGEDYKLVATGCVSGADSPAEGVQPEDPYAKCPVSCATANKCGIGTYDVTNTWFYTSYAIYSDEAACW